MNDDQSPVDHLKETLNSRTSYVPPGDVRSPVHSGPPSDAPETWDSPKLDALIEAHHDTDHGSSKLKKIFFFSMFLFLVAAGIAAYVFFGGSNFISTKNVDIVVTGPAVIEAGAPLTLTVSVDNKNNAPLDGAIISVQYPDGTRQADNQALSLAHGQADIGVIAAGGEATQTFTSALFGEKGSVETLKFTLQYKVQGSSAIFYKDKSVDITIGDTPLVISVDHPSTVPSDNVYGTRIVVASNSSDVLKNIVVRAEYPYGYAVSSAVPAAANTSNNFWQLGDIAPGDKKTITVQGSISGVDEEERTFRYYAGIADASNPASLSDALVSITDTIKISRPSLGLTISMGGDTQGDYIAPMGRSVDATILYTNNSPSKLVNTRIVARITGPVDKTSIRPSQGGFYDSNTGTVVWQSPALPSLQNVAPGDSGSVTVSFASLGSLPLNQSQALVLSADISGTPDGIASGGAITNSATKTVKISSTVNFSGKALYSRGPFKNIGPIPPKAEATTTYTIVLDLGNTQNEVGNGVVTAQLGPNVKFAAGGASGTSDAVSYDPDKNVVTWNVGTLASGAGFSAPLREADFQVAIKPSIGQIGTQPTLVSGITFSGTDTFTKLPVSATLQSITTRLTSDSAFVQGDDTVVK